MSVFHPTVPAAVVRDVFAARAMYMHEFIADMTRAVIDLPLTGVLDR